MMLEKQKTDSSRGRPYWIPVSGAPYLQVQFEIANLLVRALSLESAAPMILELLGAGLDIDRINWWRLDSDRETWVREWTWVEGVTTSSSIHDWELGSEVPMNDGIFGEILSSREPRSQERLEETSTPTQAHSDRFQGVQAGIWMPLTDMGSICGILELLSTERRRFNKELLEALKLTGEMIGRFMVRLTIDRRLRESESQLELITSRVPVVLAHFDRKGVCTFINNTYERWLGADKKDFVGQRPESVLERSLWERVKPHFEKALNGEAIDFETQFTAATGETRVAHVSFRPDLSREGDVLGLVALAHDVTETLKTSELISTNAFLDSLIENIPNMIFVKDAKELRFVRFNRAGEELLGVPREEMIGKNDFDFFPEEQARYFQKMDRETLHSGHVTQIQEEAIQSIRLGPRILHTKKIPILDENGRPRFLLGISEDITERKRAEQERWRLLQVEAAKAESDRIAARMSILSEAGPVLYSSLDFQETLKSLANFLVPDFAEWCVIHLFENGRPKPFTVAHIDPEKAHWAWEVANRYAVDGAGSFIGANLQGESELIPRVSMEMIQATAKDKEQLELLKKAGFYSYMAAPLKARGNLLGVLSLYSTLETKREFTIADLRLLEELGERAGLAVDNARLYREAQLANQMKDEFLATLSHELRTPLNVIQGHAEVLKLDWTDMSPEDLQRSVDAIYRNAVGQAQIIDDLLDVSRIITGKLGVHPVDIAPAEIVSAQVANLQPVAEDKGVVLKGHVKNAPQLIQADPTRLQQMLWNLISNAVKFTPPGGHVDVRVEEKAGSCLFEVSDTGIGIDPEFLPHVFDRFRQEDGGITRRFGGLGLGLSIVRSLAEAHGGTVSAESRGRGRGARFIVSLPLSGAASRASLFNPLYVAQRRDIEALPLAGLDILLIEDSPDNRQLIVTILKKSGALVREAGSAEEAREQLKRKRPNLILSDIGMPVEDGITFIGKLRDSEKSSGSFIPAIALTAYVRDEEIGEILRAGFQSHIPKPIRIRQVVDVLSSFRRQYGI